MKLKAWRHHPYVLHPDSLLKTEIRESKLRRPNGLNTRSVPSVQMIVTNYCGNCPKLSGVFRGPKYEVYLEDSEYNIKTSYGKNFESLEQAKFVADIKLIELGFEIEEPFLLEVKMSDKKTDGIVSDEDCYFTCISCDRPARKVDVGRCIECYNKEFDSKTEKKKAKPHIDRFLANDPIEW
jgi:hypothetical protein